MLYISITADYELFFGKNYFNEEEIMIKPTYKLLDTAMKYNVPVTLMADVCSVWKYREYGLEDYPQKVEKQLKYAIRNGHDVQLHVHPHWINSKYKDRKWTFDEDIYKIHDLGFDFSLKKDISANKIIIKGKEYLENLLKDMNEDYKCVAFRAGGWCLQPEVYLLKALKCAGINIDTTLFKGGYLKNETHYFNYRNIPDKLSYWVNPEDGINTIRKKEENNIFEVCIGSLDNKPYIYLLKIINKILKRGRKTQLRGVPIGHNKTHKTLKGRFAHKACNFIRSPIMFSLEDNHRYILLKIVDYYLKNYNCKDNDYYMSLICHPKVLYEHNFMDLDFFIKELLEKDNIRFCSLSSIEESL